MTKLFNRMMDTREKILDRALELFNKKGIEYVGMRELAAALKIRVGNITYYFPTKDHLVFSLSEQYSSVNTQIHADHKVTSLYDFLKKDEKLFKNGIQYRSLVLSMVHLMEQNAMMATNYEVVRDMRLKGLKQSIMTLEENRFLKTLTAEQRWFLVSSNSLVNRFWMSEAAVSGRRREIDTQVGHYLKLLAVLFRPYATKKGIGDVDRFLDELGYQPA